MIKKRIYADVDSLIKTKFAESAQLFGGEPHVIGRFVEIWIAMSKEERVHFIFGVRIPTVIKEPGKRTDIGFTSDAKNGKVVR